MKTKKDKNLRTLYKVASLYMKNLVLYDGGDKAYIYRNGVCIANVGIYPKEILVHYTNSFKDSILSLLGLESYGFYFGEYSNNYYVSSNIKDIFIDKLNQYFFKPQHVELVKNLSVVGGQDQFSPDVTNMKRINLY